MTDYLQPAFYRFNRDSLVLVNWVREQVDSCSSILDLGAGCGVIGIELAHCLRPDRLDLVEVQEDFREFLEKNILALPRGTRVDLRFQSFSSWSPSEKYDLVVCNPPYYLPGRGEASTDERRGIARSFIRDDWGELLSAIRRSLAPNGSAFLVIKNNLQILNEVMGRTKDSGLSLKVDEFEDLRLLRLNVD